MTGRLFGLDLESDFPLASCLAPPSGSPRLRFSCRKGPPEDPPGPPLNPVFTSGRIVDGESVTRLLSRPGLDVLRFAQVAEYHLSDEHIHCRLHSAAYRHLVEIRLLGPVLAFWLERRGFPALHASAVAIDGRAVAFLGTSGAGKTTLAAALIAAGFPLLSDDILILESRDVGDGLGIHARPGYPQMRLWPDQARHFLGALAPAGGWRSLPLVHPAYAKRRVPVGGGQGEGRGLGSFCGETLPLGRLYLIERRPEGQGGGIRGEPMQPRQAFIECVRHSFAPHLVEAAGLQAERFSQFARLLAQAPPRRLTVPAGFQHLDEIVAFIRDDLPPRH